MFGAAVLIVVKDIAAAAKAAVAAIIVGCVGRVGGLVESTTTSMRLRLLVGHTTTYCYH